MSVPPNQQLRLIEEVEAYCAHKGHTLPQALKALSISKGQWTLLKQESTNVQALLSKNNRWLAAMSMGIDIAYIIYGQTITPLRRAP